MTTENGRLRTPRALCFLEGSLFLQAELLSSSFCSVVLIFLPCQGEPEQLFFFPQKQKISSSFPPVKPVRWSSVFPLHKSPSSWREPVETRVFIWTCGRERDLRGYAREKTLLKLILNSSCPDNFWEAARTFLINH